MANADFLAYLQGRRNPNGFNPYAAGDKRYGFGRRGPNVGPTNDTLGYAKRDREAKGRRNAILRRMQARQKGKYASANAQRYIPNSAYPGPGGS